MPSELKSATAIATGYEPAAGNIRGYRRKDSVAFSQENLDVSGAVDEYEIQNTVLVEIARGNLPNI